MSEIIKDGTGKGFYAGVSNQNKLLVRSTSSNLIHQATLLGDAFIAPLLFKQVSGDTEELAAIIEYTGVRTCIANNLIISSQDANITQTTVYAGTIASGGYPSAFGNLNTTSSKTFPGSVLIQLNGNAPFSGVTFGLHMYQLNIVGGGMERLETTDSLIIKPNLVLGLGIKCTNTNSLVRAYLSIYEIDL